MTRRRLARLALVLAGIAVFAGIWLTRHALDVTGDYLTPHRPSYLVVVGVVTLWVLGLAVVGVVLMWLVKVAFVDEKEDEDSE